MLVDSTQGDRLIHPPDSLMGVQYHGTPATFVERGRNVTTLPFLT